MELDTQKITLVGILGAVTVILGMTPLGFVPVPTPAGSATIMHVPVIIGAILEGPVVGGLVGFVFGVFSFLRAGNPFVADPLIGILPRIFIGILAGYSYKLINKESVAVGLAAAFGTLTNTIGVLGLAVWRGYLPLAAAIGIGFTHGLPEIVVAIIITILLVKVLNNIR
ncbi:ECF transporter S component [Sporohalobacter salinus]|uniref:ECF transporter S component n=1 Tax=Sporohalobacter salinus TaxID=1494606 RepID=UPI001960A742|nr:ECF transporter S component [Sporohalobacter salinus]MBM7624045.1 putative membrane protein [Sporohalobacter salinus]